MLCCIKSSGVLPPHHNIIIISALVASTIPFKSPHTNLVALPHRKATRIYNIIMHARSSLAVVGRKSLMRLLATAAPAISRPNAVRLFASVGDKLPSVDLHLGFPPKKHNLADFAKNKSILVVGLPGAFTPTW